MVGPTELESVTSCVSIVSAGFEGLLIAGHDYLEASEPSRLPPPFALILRTHAQRWLAVIAAPFLAGWVTSASQSGLARAFQSIAVGKALKMGLVPLLAHFSTKTLD
jgi:hypothetical protein